MRPSEFSWCHPRATSNQTCDREIVMRCAQRRTRYWGGATRCGSNCTNLGRLSAHEIWQDAVKCMRQHGLPNTRRPLKQQWEASDRTD